MLHPDGHLEVEFFQSNHEGDLIDEIQSAAGRADGIVLNPGGYAHYSVAILDALRLCGVPAVEVLLQRPRRAGALPQDGRASPSAVRATSSARASAAISTPAAYLAQLLRLDGSAHTHLVM